jgi:hypothetical protein
LKDPGKAMHEIENASNGSVEGAMAAANDLKSGSQS